VRIALASRLTDAAPIVFNLKPERHRGMRCSHFVRFPAEAVGVLKPLGSDLTIHHLQYGQGEKLATRYQLKVCVQPVDVRRAILA
jgi:hypothetical protein